MSLFNLAVLISGSGTNLQAVIDAVSDGRLPNTKIALVVSSRSGAYGIERAKKHGIANIVVDRSNVDKLPEILRFHNIKGIILAGYLTILPPDVVSAYEGKIINIHPALLPKFGGKGFYGIKVHQAVIESGDKQSGATAHIVDCGIDTGPTLVQGILSVQNKDTAESLQKKVLEVEHIVLVEAIRALVKGEIDILINNPKTIRMDKGDL